MFQKEKKATKDGVITHKMTISMNKTSNLNTQNDENIKIFWKALLSTLTNALPVL